MHAVVCLCMVLCGASNECRPYHNCTISAGSSAEQRTTLLKNSFSASICISLICNQELNTQTHQTMPLSFIKQETLIDDDASVNTKNTQLTSGTTSSRRTVRSAANKRRKIAAERRIFIRDMFANIFDLVGDWAFFFAIFHRDFDGDGQADQFSPVEVEYRLFINAVFAFAILSSTLVGWFVLTSLWKKTGREMCCNCTAERILLAAVILEDIPQILFTLYMEQNFMGGLSAVGMLNICSSVNGMVNRLTAHYDIKEDVFVMVDSYKEMP